MPPRKGQVGPKNLIASAKIPLPQCDGPKLHPFADDKANLEFVRLLLDPTLDADAHVFEVSIGGQSYALKAVRLLFFISPRFRRSNVWDSSSNSTMMKRTLGFGRVRARSPEPTSGREPGSFGPP